MFYNFDKRILYVILAVMVIYGLSGYLTDTNSFLNLLYSIPAILIAITFHEFAHAKVADILGDDTPRYEGRLSLNPLDHIDPVGFIMLIFAGFGWGKPVHVNPINYNRDISMDKANCLVSIAGPLTNFVLAIIFTFIYYFILKIKGQQMLISTAGSIIMTMIMYVITINIGLGVFNLIPLPPLDGSKVIKPFLSYNVKQWFENNERTFYYIFIVLWITGIAGHIISPIIRIIFNWLMKLGSFIL